MRNEITSELTRLNDDLGFHIHLMTEEGADGSVSILGILLLHGWRLVLCGKNSYLVNDNVVIDTADYDSTLELLENYCEPYLHPDAFTIIWSYAREHIELLAMDVRELIMKAGMSADEWWNESMSKDNEVGLIRQLYAEFGPCFFELNPKQSDSFTEYVRSTAQAVEITAAVTE